MLQDNIETTLLATGTPVSACVVLRLNNSENLANQIENQNYQTGC